MLRFFAIVYGIVCLCTGCAYPRVATGTQMSKEPPCPAEGPLSLACLPAVDAAKEAHTDRIHQALLLAMRVFDQRLSAAPADRRQAPLQAWVDDAVVDWVEGRSQALAEIRFQFGMPLRASEAERVVAEATLGLLQEDTALQLAELPVPVELAEEPEIRTMYGEMLAQEVRPLFAAALVSFRECANLAFDGPAGLRHFAPFCDARFRGLRARIEGPASLPPRAVAGVQ